jgi:hypothetical protein
VALVTQSEYAKRRGCSEAAVSAARRDRIKAAEVVRDGRVLIDEKLADELWARNTKRRRGGNLPKTPPVSRAELTKPPPLPTDEQLLAIVQGLPEDAIPSIVESEARKEHYLAERARVQVLKEREQVGSIADMKREAFALAKSVREGMLAIVPRISADLAALADPFEIEQRLEAEVLTALRGLADG